MSLGPSAHSYSHPGVVEVYRMPGWFTTNFFINISPQKRMKAKKRGDREVGDSEIVFPSAGVLINIVIVGL